MKIKEGDYLEITPLSDYCQLPIGARLKVTESDSHWVYWKYPLHGFRKDAISQKDAIKRFKHIPSKMQMENK